MAKKQTPEDSHFAMFLQRFIKRQNGMLKVYNEITSGFDAEISAVQASGSGNAKLAKLIQHFEEFETLKNNFYKYFDKQASTENAIEDIGERIKLYSAVPKKDLVEILATTAYEYELMHHEIRYLSAATLFFQSKFSSSSIKDVQVDFIRQSTKQLRDEVNAKCLRHSLEMLKERVSRPLRGSDLLQFYRTVEELYPVMPIPKKARLHKDEKKLPKHLQEEVLKEKQTDKWKPSSLRSFFERETGLKATTKK